MKVLIYIGTLYYFKYQYSKILTNNLDKELDMKSILKNTILSACALGLLAGCASKDVEYDENAAQNKSAVDNKMDNVAGSDEGVVSDNADQTTTNSDDMNTNSSDLQVITNDSVNSVTSDIDGQTVLLESVHFAFDKYNLSDAMREVSSANYSKIVKTQENYEGLKVKLEGNCDEWGTDEYNYALGLKRAKSAKDALVADGMPEDKIIMVSFGESNPVCTQRNNACWKMNRRVDYRLLP